MFPRENVSTISVVLTLTGIFATGSGLGAAQPNRISRDKGTKHRLSIVILPYSFQIYSSTGIIHTNVFPSNLLQAVLKYGWNREPAFHVSRIGGRDHETRICPGSASRCRFDRHRGPGLRGGGPVELRSSQGRDLLAHQ